MEKQSSCSAGVGGGLPVRDLSDSESKWNNQRQSESYNQWRSEKTRHRRMAEANTSSWRYRRRREETRKNTLCPSAENEEISKWLREADTILKREGREMKYRRRSLTYPENKSQMTRRSCAYVKANGLCVCLRRKPQLTEGWGKRSLREAFGRNSVTAQPPVESLLRNSEEASERENLLSMLYLETG